MVLGGVEMSVLRAASPARLSGALRTAHIPLLQATATLSAQWRVLVGTGPNPAFFVLFCLEMGSHCVAQAGLELGSSGPASVSGLAGTIGMHPVSSSLTLPFPVVK